MLTFIDARTLAQSTLGREIADRADTSPERVALYVIGGLILLAAIVVAIKYQLDQDR